jgi:hypothetical protein
MTKKLLEITRGSRKFEEIAFTMKNGRKQL